MSELTDRLFERKFLATQRGAPLQSFEVTEQEYRELLTLAVVHHDSPPNPPVKSRFAVIREAGFFCKELRFEHTEYDHHAPAYLEAMRRWLQKPTKPPMLFGIPVIVKQ